jgi:hypothetical protein
MAYVTDSTISGNIASKSGGGISAGGGADFFNSIAGGNNARIGPDSDSDLYAAVSLIQSSSGPIHTVPGYPNITGQSPQLEPLSYSAYGSYGGFMKPAPTSPVVDQGYTRQFHYDERGVSRPVDNPFVSNGPGSNGADMGAVELTLDEGPQTAPPPPTPTPTPTPTPASKSATPPSTLGATARSHKKCKKKKKKCKKKKRRSVARFVAFRGSGPHWPGGAEQHPFRLTP